MRLSDGQKEVSKTSNGGSIPSGCVSEHWKLNIDGWSGIISISQKIGGIKMPDIKKLLEASVNLGVYDTLGELYSTLYTESLLAEKTNFDFLKSSKDGFEELKKNMEIWQKEYGVNENTPLKDILNKLQ